MTTTHHSRGQEIFEHFLQALDVHMKQLASEHVNDKYTVQDFAELLHVHPIHLTNVIKAVSGRTPCSFYKEKLIILAKELLSDRTRSISQVANVLTFDPSNFSKFFKRSTGQTPRQYQETQTRLGLKKLKPSP
jgi:AraC family transcriptional regulator, regulatory protein of adaptative response / methylphosphotriester-DNA alkyltransferase methyltransferase